MKSNFYVSLLAIGSLLLGSSGQAEVGTFGTFSATPVPHPEKRVALLIANEYSGDVQLPGMESDARLLANQLRALGFEVTLKVNADYASMVQAIEAHTKKLDSSTLNFFYFTGHGGTSGGEDYLLSNDLTAKHKLVPASYIAKASAQAAPQAMNIIVLDTVRSSFGEQKVECLPPACGFTDTDGPRPEAILAYAAEFGTVALSGAPLQKNSPYVLALVRNLQIRGLTLEEVLRRVRADVIKTTDGRQHPSFTVNMSREIVLNPLTK